MKSVTQGVCFTEWSFCGPKITLIQVIMIIDVMKLRWERK